MMIRELTESELPALLELYKHLHATDDPLPSQGEAGRVWAAIQTQPNLKYFGVFEDDLLVSGRTLSIIPNLTRCCRPYGVIEGDLSRSTN